MRCGEYVFWPRKGSQMKTQTQILDNRLYYTRKIDLHRKGNKSRTVRITPIVICGICCSPHLTGKCGTRPFLGGSGRRAGAHTRPTFPKMPTAPSAFPLLGVPQAPDDKPTHPEGGKSLGGRPPEAERKSPGTETHSARSVPQITRPAEVLPGNWRGSDRDWSAVFDARPTLRACMAQGLFLGGTGRRAVAHTRPEFVKNTLGPVGIALVRGASGAGQWTQPPSKGGKSLVSDRDWSAFWQRNL